MRRAVSRQSCEEPSVRRAESSQGAAGTELSVVLQQLQAVERLLQEQIAEFHDSQRRLEERLEVRLTEAVAAQLKQGPTTHGIEAALQRCLQRFMPPVEAGSSSVTAPQMVRDVTDDELTAAAQGSRKHTARALTLTGKTSLRTQSMQHVTVSDQAPEADADTPRDQVPPLRTASNRSSSKAFTEGPPELEEGTDTASTRPKEGSARRIPKPEYRGRLSLPQASRADVHTIHRDGQIFPLHPSSSLVRIYDLLIFVLLICEVVFVPYQGAFAVTIRRSTFFTVWTIVALFGWSTDLVAGFLIGAYKKGELVMDLRMIASLYVRRGFLLNLITLFLDVCCAAAEWALASEDEDDTPLFIILLKSSRLVRVCVKLYGTGRALSLLSIAEFLVGIVRRRGISTQIQALVQICGALFVILIVNHLGACSWWMISSHSIDDYISSTDLVPSRTNRYWLAYYNSVSLMIAGENIFTPGTEKEIVATIGGIYFGFVFVSVVISKVATSLIDFHIANKENSDKLQLLQKYLQQHRVGAEVAIPVEKQIFERLRSFKWLSDQDVPVLSILSPCLKVELLRAVYGGSVRRLPLLAACDCMDEHYIKDVCYNALDTFVLDPGHRVFAPGNHAAGAYFLSWGVCEYSVPLFEEDVAMPVASVDATQVRTQMWVAELALWYLWDHRGCLECSKSCELLHLPTGRLMQVLGHRPILAKVTQDYMYAIADAIDGEPPEKLTDLSMCVAHETVITSMPLESRWGLSEAALSMLGNNGGSWVRPFGQKGLKELAGEARAGTCDLIVDEERRVKRVVNVVALRLTRSDGKVFARVAEKKGSTLDLDLVLPGTKVRGGELPFRALSRFLENQLGDLGPHVQTDSREVKTLERLSNAYGVNTKYMRTVFHATLDADRPSPSPTVSGGLARRRPDVPVPQEVPSLRSTTGATYEMVFLVDRHKSDHVTICIWMGQTEFNALTSPNAEMAAKQWVNSLGLEQVAIPQGGTTGESPSRGLP